MFYMFMAMSALSGMIPFVLLFSPGFLGPPIRQNGIFDKPFASFQWYGENCEIKFGVSVNVVFLTNPNLLLIKISKTKSTQIQIMKSNSNFDKNMFQNILHFSA